MSMDLPRSLRAGAAYGLALMNDGLSRFALRLARGAARRRPSVAGDELDLAIGVRAIARELGVSRREAWGLIRSGEVSTFLLAGGPCARRSALQARAAASRR